MSRRSGGLRGVSLRPILWRIVYVRQRVQTANAFIRVRLSTDSLDFTDSPTRFNGRRNFYELFNEFIALVFWESLAMDPLSISASLLGLADITARLVSRIARFVRDANSVDEVLRAFYAEVSTLDINLRLAGKVILSHADLSHVPESEEFLSSIGNTVGNIEKTIQRLQQLVPEDPPQESASRFQKFLKQRSLDKKLPEILMLRLKMVSYNSSLQTVLQAIDISLNIRIKTQTDPSQFADSFFRATNALEEQLTQLRTDIFKLSEASEEAEKQEEKPHLERVVTSMRAAEFFAERIHSKASTLSAAQSEYNRETMENSKGSGKKLTPSYVAPNTKSNKAGPFTLASRADLELLQAQESLRRAREKCDKGNFSVAKDLCSEALDELSEVEGSSVDAYIEYTILLQASILACMGDPEDIIESRRLVKTVDVQQLVDIETDDLVLDRMLLLCWTKLRLSSFDEAERLTRTLIRDSREWNGDEDNHYYNEARVILALIYYCQNRARKARSLVKIMPTDYLFKKCYEKGYQPRQHLGQQKVPKDKHKDIFCLLSQPGYETAAFCYVHYEYPNDPIIHDHFLAYAVVKNSLPVIAMLATRRAPPVATNGACTCHTDVACPQMRNADSPWEVAVSRNLVLDFTPLVERLILQGDPDIFKVLLDASSGKTVTAKFKESLTLALRLSIKHNAGRIVAVLMASYKDLDLRDAFAETGKKIDDVAFVRPLDLVDVLVDHGFKIEGINGIWQNPLHDAVQFRCDGMMNWMIKKGGAQVDVSSTNCFTDCDDLEVIHAARELKLDPQISLTPLQLAVVKYSADPGSRLDLRRKVRLLIEAGADPTMAFLDGQNCFDLALRDRHFDLLECLIESKFLISNIDRRYQGHTILQWTLDLNRKETSIDESYLFRERVHYLIELGADPMVLDDQGQTCFHLAARHELGAVSLPELLKSRHPIDLEHLDMLGNTVADIAKGATEVYDEYYETSLTGDEAGEHLLSILREAGASAPRGLSSIQPIAKITKELAQSEPKAEFVQTVS